MKSLLLLLALAVPSFGQEAEQVFTLPLFRDGLYTRYSANAIPDGALADALNVLIDEDVDGVVVARNGYAKYNSSPITDEKTVRGLWPFDASDGTKYLVALSSETFYKTTGDGAWTAIVGLDNFSLTKDFDCVQTLGSLYCANGDTVFSWNGTSTATISGAPLGNIVGRFRNRLLMAGIAGAKARLRGSGELDTSDWALQVPGVSTTPFSIPFGGVDDGEDITCLMGAFQDVFIVGKRNSLWGLYGFGRNDFQVRELSREVGCIESRSVREKNNCLYWMSLRGIEKFCGANIERIGDPIRDKIDTIVATAGNARSALDTTQTDFELGDLEASGPGAPVSASITPGSVVASTFSSTVKLSLNNFIFQTENGEFADGTTSGWTKSGTWTVASALAVSGGSCYGARVPSVAAKGAYPPSDAALSRTIRLDMLDSLGASLKNCSITSTCNGSNICFSAASTDCDLIRPANQPLFYLSNNGYSNVSLKITDQSSGGYLISGSTSNFSYMGVYVGSPSGQNSVSVTSCELINYSTAGFTSAAFNTGFSTPTFGALSFEQTSVSGSTVGVTFETRTSTSADGEWSALQVTPIGSSVTSPSRQFVEFSASSGPTGTSAIAWGNGLDGNISLLATTTGYFISQCRNPSIGITSWGLFTCNQTLNDGNLAYYISTGTTCDSVTRATATWTAQTNNATISVATAAYVAYRVLFDIDAATDTPRVQDCTISWQEGETRPPVASQVYRDRYYLAYTSSTASGASNDHLLVLDKNDKWTLFNNHSCYSLAFYNRKLYCGSSTAAGQVWLLDQGTDDDGAAILSRIRSKAFHFGAPERRKEYRRLYLDLEPSPDPAQTITLTGRYTLERSTPTYSLGNIDLNEDPGSIMTPRIPFSKGNPTTGRYLQLELESDGQNSPWRLFSGRLYYSPLDPE